MSTTFARAWNELDVGRYKAELYRMWHIGFKAGLTHERTLSTAGPFDRSPSVERMRLHLLDGARRRISLGDAIGERPDLFIPFEAGLLELGEEAGGLEKILEILGQYFESEHSMNLWVKKKMSYPMVNIIAAIFIVPFPILYFGDVARYLITVSVEVAAALVFGGGLLRAIARYFRNRPKVVLARLCRALALGVESGLSLDRVVDLGVAAADNAGLTAHVRRVPKGLRGGQPLVETFTGSPLMPPEMLAALSVANETGDYGNTLERLAELYEDGF